MWDPIFCGYHFEILSHFLLKFSLYLLIALDMVLRKDIFMQDMKQQ